MRVLLLWAIGLSLSGICLMCYGIGFINVNPMLSLPFWVKISLLLLALIAVIVYSLLALKLIVFLANSNSSNLIGKGGIWL